MGKESIESIEARLGETHSFLAEGLLAPFNNQTNQNRGQMFSSHISQCIQMSEADTPLIYTGFENQVGSASTSGYQSLEGDWMVLKKLVKNPMSYYLILQNLETNEYDLVHRESYTHLTEIFGHENHNETMDGLDEGDIVGDTVLTHDNNYDESMNFKYGKNIRVVYLPYQGYTNEDSIVMSESTARAMSTPFVEKVRIRINTNDIPLNLYGDETSYKSFPNVGEEVRPDGILLGTRRISYSEIVNKFQDRQMRTTLKSDSLKFVNRKSKVVDIDIWNNNELENLQEPYNEQLLRTYGGLREFYKEVVTYLQPIVEDPDKQVSSDLLFFYNQIAAKFDPLSEFSEDGRRFDNMIVEFTVQYDEPINIASKLTARFGNKGTVGKIVPDEEMPELTHIDGEERKDTRVQTRADIVCNPFGVINRLNSSTLVELETNYMATIIRYRLDTWDWESIDEQWEYISKFLQMTDPNEENYQAYQDLWENLDGEGKHDLIEDMILHGIPLKQEPFWRNINSFDVYDMYKEFNIDLSPNTKSSNPVAIGEMYYLRLIFSLVTFLIAGKSKHVMM